MLRAARLLVILVYAAVAAGIYAAAVRWRVEMPNRAVALIVDWSEVEALAAAQGITVRRALRQLRDAGATAVALREQHLSDLVAAGQITVVPASAAGLEPLSPGDGLVLSACDDATAERVRAHLRAKLPPGTRPPAAPGLLIPCRASPAYLETVGIGWPLEQQAIASESGLSIVVRLDNYPGVRPEAIRFMVAQGVGADATLVIFARDQVLGYPGLIGETAADLTAAGLRYGSVELTRQLGDQALGLALRGAVVRVHSITEPEMPTLSPQRAIERYLRAVKDRGVRACYVRLFLTARERPMEYNCGYLAALARRLEAAGYRGGAPQVLAPVAIPSWLMMVMFAGAVAAAVLALGRVVPLPEWLSYLLFIVGLGMGTGLLHIAPHLARAEKALLAALAFPSIALIAVARGARTQRAASGVSAAGLAARAGAWLIGASIVSAAGGLVVSGILSDRLYMTQVLQFVGVKVSLALPLLAVGAVWALGLSAAHGWAAYRRRVQENFQRLWNRPVYVWEAALAAALAAAALLMLMRSGNQPAVEVSGLEMRARGLLEQVFFARPRTKEFLVGHPALMLAVAMALRGRRRWVLFLLLLGAVGQTSLVNTFCHLHTPVFVSLLRSAHGLWLGLGVGAVLVWAWDLLHGSEVAEGAEQPTTGS